MKISYRDSYVNKTHFRLGKYHRYDVPKYLGICKYHQHLDCNHYLCIDIVRLELINNKKIVF